MLLFGLIQRSLWPSKQCLKIVSNNFLVSNMFFDKCLTSNLMYPLCIFKSYYFCSYDFLVSLCFASVEKWALFTYKCKTTLKKRWLFIKLVCKGSALCRLMLFMNMIIWWWLIVLTHQPNLLSTSTYLFNFISYKYLYIS